MLILAFPDFDYWFLAWFALVPLMWAIEREKDSTAKSFVTGWLFGTVFFFGTCWWLTFAPINYAGFPWWLAYFLLLCVCLVVGLFPALFAGLLSVFLRRKGPVAMADAAWIWVAMEFLRYWLTGNNWNAIGYSTASGGPFLSLAAEGGIYLVSGFLAIINSTIAMIPYIGKQINLRARYQAYLVGWIFLMSLALFFVLSFLKPYELATSKDASVTKVVAVQPNVPMSGLDYSKYDQLRQRQVELSEGRVNGVRNPPLRLKEGEPVPVHGPEFKPYQMLVVLPESPMNYAYNDDREFQQFIGDFARRNNVSVLFNSAEPDVGTTKYFNSAVMVGPDGKESAQYDKIYLLPFGEAVPRPLEGILPGFVGNFAYGREYDILPVGDAKAGVMICFESHFGALSREYVRNGADVLIEMTNDGYLGPTPVLRQHLANAVFRAVETNRPVLRVTNVGITAYINERGQVLDEAPSYQEATRVWSVAKSDGSQTFYVKYGDWFAWLCSIITIGLIGYALFRRRQQTV